MKNVIVHGDSFDFFPHIESQSIDLLFTDPPYGTTKCEWDIDIDLDAFWNQAHRVAKSNTPICVMSVEPFKCKLMLSNLENYKYDWIWMKHKPSNFPQVNNRPLRYHEFISVFYKEQPYYNPQKIPRKSERVSQMQKNGNKTKFIRKNSIVSCNMNENSGMREINIENLNADWSFPNSIIEIPAVVSNSKELENHSTQKPIRLYEYFLKTYTKKGDTVFDPFGGSGPLVDACLRLDRNFIIIEREKKYINMIKQRVRKFFKNSITFTQKNESNCIIYEYKKPFDEFL